MSVDPAVNAVETNDNGNEGTAHEALTVVRRRTSFHSVALLCLALLCAIVGQLYLVRRQFPLDGAIFYIVAAVLFYRAVRRLPAPDVPAAAVAATRWSLRRCIPAALLAALAIVLFWRNNPNPAIMLSIAAALALVGAYWREALSEAGKIRLERWEWLALGGILLVGLGLRLYRLASLPGDLYLDEGDVGQLALRVLRSTTYFAFTPDYTGHPTFFFTGLAIFVKVLGISALSMRLYVVLIGMLTIVATYALGRELLGPRGALIAAFVMAVSSWAITFNRIVFVGSAVPLFVALTIYFLLRALRTHQPLDFILSGLAMGLGLNTYLAFRVVPFLVALYLLYKVIGNRSFLRIYGASLVLLALAFIIAFTPLGIYYAKHPADLLSRTEAASVFLDIQREKSNAPLWANIRKAFGMFNYQGDPRPRHNVPNNPMADPITGIFLVFGFSYALFRWRKAENSMLITWLVLGMLPGVLSLADSNPHSLRTIVNLPAIAVLAGLGAERTITLILSSYNGRQARRALLALAVGAAVLALVANYNEYFRLYATNKSVYYDFDPVQNAVANEIKRIGNSQNVFVAGAFTNHSAVKLLDDGINYQTFNQTAHMPLRDVNNKDSTFILEPIQAPLLSLFQSYYPDATISSWADRYGNPGYLKVTVPRAAATEVQGVKASYYAGAERSGDPAVQRVEPTINADWGAATPLDPPFSALWHGALYINRYGPYDFILETTTPATVTLDGQSILTSPGGRQAVSLTPYAGFHDLQVETTVSDRSGAISLRWKPPDGPEQVIPQSNLFTLDVASNGLLGKYYRGDSWTGQPSIVQKDLFISPNDLLPAPFSIEWEGKIYAPQDGQYVFGTSSDDGSLLYIDNKLVVDNNGHHSERYVEGRADLTQGLHDLRLRYFQDDGGRVMDLYWAPPGGSKQLVPNGVLFPPGAVISGPITIATPIALPTPFARPAATPAPGAPAVKPAAPVPGGPRAGELGPIQIIGRAGSGQGEFNNPKGVAVAGDGKIYVADTGNKRVQVFDHDGKFLAEWKGGQQPFVDPTGIAIAPNGDVYVLEAEKDGAQRFSAQGQPLGRVGDGLGLYRPRGLNIDGAGTLFFANTGGNVVVRASAAGQAQGTIGTGGKNNGQLAQPTDANVSATGDIFVADTYNQRIQRFSSDGRYLRQWAIPQSGTSNGPHIAVGPDGTLYVTDPDNAQVSAYTPDGAIVATWGSQGSGDGQFIQPVGIFMDSSGTLYIADSGNNRIQVWGKR